MKKFLKVTVNGVAYDVMVEDVKESDNIPVSNVASEEPKNDVVKEEKKDETVVTANKEESIKVTAPMPGNIWKIKASVGQRVERHEVLLILEAMKMENEIVAPEAGTVTAILVKEGDAVEPGKIMVELA